MAYICITPTAADGSPLDPLTYEVDSDEGRAAARRALAEARIEQGKIYVGEPDGEGDSHTNGQVLLALKCQAYLLIEGGTCNGEEDAFESYVEAVAELLPANFRLTCGQAPFRSVGEHGEETERDRELSQVLWTAYCEQTSHEDAVETVCAVMLG